MKIPLHLSRLLTGKPASNQRYGCHWSACITFSFVQSVAMFDWLIFTIAIFQLKKSNNNREIEGSSSL